MKWDYERFHAACTVFILREGKILGYSERDVLIESGILKDLSGKSERRAKSATRKWNLRDIVLIANLFKTNPSTLLDKIETFCSENSHEQLQTILQTEFKKTHKKSSISTEIKE